LQISGHAKLKTMTQLLSGCSKYMQGWFWRQKPGRWDSSSNTFSCQDFSLSCICIIPRIVQEQDSCSPWGRKITPWCQALKPGVKDKKKK